jgi:hypothetical protein
MEPAERQAAPSTTGANPAVTLTPATPADSNSSSAGNNYEGQNDREGGSDSAKAAKEIAARTTSAQSESKSPAIKAGAVAAVELAANGNLKTGKLGHMNGLVGKRGGLFGRLVCCFNSPQTAS